MSVFDFINQSELDDLDEDPHVALMVIVDHAQHWLAEQTKGLNLQDETDWDTREELQYSFMNVIVAAGNCLEIEPFVSMQVPKHSKSVAADYRQFRFRPLRKSVIDR